MFQVPRDTSDVPVPANARPVWGSLYRGKINSWYAQNRVRTDLWRGSTSRTRGFNALKSLLGELYGLDIRYYVMVNFAGFRDAVNTLGGVQVNVQIPVAESDYPVTGGVTRIYIPAGPQHMTGAEALIYARSRHRAHRRRLRPRPAPAAGARLAARADERAVDHRQPRQPREDALAVRQDRHPAGRDAQAALARRQRRHEEHPLLRVRAAVTTGRTRPCPSAATSSSPTSRASDGP